MSTIGTIGYIILDIDGEDDTEDDAGDVYKLSFSPPRDLKKLVHEVDDCGRTIHFGVKCDICNQPLHGIRYKCVDCIDFDMCQECEAKKEHPQHHITLKIPVHRRVNSGPMSTSGYNVAMIEQIKQN